jgi:hypothetical protein
MWLRCYIVIRLTRCSYNFVSSRDSQKYMLLCTQPQIPRSAVVGTVPNTPFTLQMRGFLVEADVSLNQNIIERYYYRRDNRNDDVRDPANCLLEFTPHGQGSPTILKVIIGSN